MWRNPEPGAFAAGPALAGIRVLRRERTFPLDEDDGDPVYDGPVVSGISDDGVRPQTTHYYTVFTVDSGTPPTYRADGASQAAAFATTNHQYQDALYRMLPAIHQRLDQPPRPAKLRAPVAAALAKLPEPLRDRGQLFRFLSVAGCSLDLTRSLAEGLRQLQDVDRTRPEYLDPLARMLGWELDRTQPVFAQRNEIAAAPYLYRNAGTVPNLRTVVSRTTGWYVQVTEAAQSIARSNLAPQFNLFAVAVQAGGLRGTDDAAGLLGFASEYATGTIQAAAKLTSTVPGPFALRPGMQLTVAADQLPPAKVVFASEDFADMATATATEVASVLNGTLSEITASVDDQDHLVFTSNTTGGASSVRVEQSLASLVTLESAPKGRLSVLATHGNRLRLFYATTDPPGQPSRIHIKTHHQGSWVESEPVPTGTAAAADPAGAELPGRGIFLAWVDRPHTAEARIRYAIGTEQPPTPPALRSGHAGPFAIRPGSRLVVQLGRHRHGVVFTAADFRDPQQVPATQLAAVLTARLPGLISTGADGTLELRPLNSGGNQPLSIDLPASDAADALGFGPANSSATGACGHSLDWSDAQNVPVPPGRVAEPFAVVDGPHHVRLFWSAHDGVRWTIATARWDGSHWGAVKKDVATGDGGNREPTAVKLTGTGGGTVRVVWSRRRGTTPLGEEWSLASRVLDLAADTWSAEQELTSPDAAHARALDREPAVIRLPDGGARVYFSSERRGESDLWSLDLLPTGQVSAPVPLLTGPAQDRAPAPVTATDGADWLLFRSDRGVTLSGLTARAAPPRDNRVTAEPVTGPASLAPRTSVRAVDTGTLRRYSGTTTVVLGAASRNSRRGRWDDLLAYTPCAPLGAAFGERPSDSDLYTRGTVALYLSPLVPHSRLSAQLEDRLRPLLARFLPINTRVVIVYTPRSDIEYVYEPEHDLAETYRDQHPYVDTLVLPAEATEAALPEWVLLRTGLPGHVSVNPSDHTTLFRRTWSPLPS
ncbi:phage tail protein [Streptomyces sp. NPDC004980]